MRRLGYLHLPCRLDIGCGRNTISNHVGIDILDFNQDILWDVREGIPLPNDSVESVHSSNFFEHLKREEIQKVISEIVRVSKPDALFTLIVPHTWHHEAFYLCHYSYWNERVIAGLCADSHNLELENIWKSGVQVHAQIRIKKGKKKMLQVLNHCQWVHKDFSECPTAGETLKKGASLMSGNWWISSGTALGLYRDGDFVKDDTDIDVGVSHEIDLTPFNDNFKLIRTTTWDNQIMQAAYQDTNGMIFDIYFYYPEGDELVNHNEFGEMRKPKRFFETKELDTKYGEFPFPAPIEEYLLMRYGENWKTPSHKKGLYTKEW